MEKSIFDSAEPQRRSSHKRRTKIIKTIIQAYKPKLHIDLGDETPRAEPFEEQQKIEKNKDESQSIIYPSLPVGGQSVGDSRSFYFSPINQPRRRRSKRNITFIEVQKLNNLLAPENKLNTTQKSYGNDHSLSRINSHTNPIEIQAEYMNDPSPVNKSHDKSMSVLNQSKFVRNNRRKMTNFSRITQLNQIEDMNKQNQDNFKDQLKKYDVRRKSLKFNSSVLSKFKSTVEKTKLMGVIGKEKNTEDGNKFNISTSNIIQTVYLKLNLQLKIHQHYRLTVFYGSCGIFLLE